VNESSWFRGYFLYALNLVRMNNCKLLIIDDDEDDVSILKDAFIKIEVDSVHYVFTAMTAFIYLESVEHNCLPKLIVTDLHLPGI
jgi:hypothetical protein